MGAALLSFNFDYGDLIRWLEGEYTNQHRDWTQLSNRIEEVRLHAQRPGYISTTVSAGIAFYVPSNSNNFFIYITLQYIVFILIEVLSNYVKYTPTLHVDVTISGMR